MAPMKSSWNRSAGKLLGLFNERDLGKDGLNGFENKNFALSSVPGVTASGGNTSAQPLTQDGIDYKYHVFTSPGNFVVSGVTGTGNIEYMLVGGGGGGGTQSAGGGGGG